MQESRSEPRRSNLRSQISEGLGSRLLYMEVSNLGNFFLKSVIILLHVIGLRSYSLDGNIDAVARHVSFAQITCYRYYCSALINLCYIFSLLTFVNFIFYSRSR